MSRNYKKLLTRLGVAQPQIHLWRAIVFAIAAALILFTAFFAVHPKVISVTADVSVTDELDFARNVDTGNYDEFARDVDSGNYDELARDVDAGNYDSLARSVDTGNVDAFISNVDGPNQDMLIRAETGNYDQLTK